MRRPYSVGLQATWILSAVAALTAGQLAYAPTAQAVPARPAPLTTPWTNQALVGTPLPE